MRILVISNSPSDKKELVDYMHRRSFQTTCMPVPADVSGTLVGDKPDLVILDLAHDNVERPRLLDETRSPPHTQVIAITGHESAEFNLATVLEPSADDCLTRPFSPHEVVARIRDILQRVKQAIQATSRKKASYWFTGRHLDLRIRRLTNPEGKPVALAVAEYALLTAFPPSRRCSGHQLLIDMTVSRSWCSPERYSPTQHLSVGRTR
jgi:DNA-binding response OmpR family regulator